MANITGSGSVKGTSANDTLRGSGGDDTLQGYTGNDRIEGGGGNDYLSGDGGNDTLLGGAGDDWLEGGTGNDSLDGGAGDDALFGGTGNDTLTGGVGDDHLDGDDGNDVLTGGKGNDILSGGGGNNTYIFNQGDGQDRIDFDYTWEGTPTAPTTDTLQFGAGISLNDLTADLSWGEVVIKVGTAGDQIRLMALSYALGYGKTVRMTFEGGGQPTDLATWLEESQGITLGKVQFGGDGDDSLTGGAGNDWLHGGGGDDTLTGGKGNDWLYGDGGSNTFIFNAGDGQDTIAFNQIEDDTPITPTTDTLRFGADISLGDLTAENSDYDVVIKVGVAGDQITLAKWELEEALGHGKTMRMVFDGDDSPTDLATWLEESQGITLGKYLFGGDGDDSLTGGAGNDRLDGGAGNDTLTGGAGDDELDGGDGDDMLTGGTGDDNLYGGDGDDTLTGGLGDDELRGGNGNNTFIFNVGDGQDRIDFHYEEEFSIEEFKQPAPTTDTLQFGAGISLGDLTAENSDDDVVIKVGAAGDQITLDGDSLEYALGHGKTVRMTFDGGGSPTDLAAWLKESQGIMLGKYQFGGDGDDSLTGGDGNDTLVGGPGNDVLKGGAGDDWLHGSYDRWLYGGDGDDTLEGGKGNDWLWGRGGNNTYIFNAGDGQDTIDFSYIWDIWDDTPTTDTLRFGAGISLGDLTAENSDEGVYSSVVIKIGVAGDQIILSNLGAVLGPGKTVLMTFDGDDPPTYLATWLTSQGIQGIVPEPGKPLTGDAGGNPLKGGDGDDTLSGLGGNDTLDGGNGDDSLDGGDGHDFLYGGDGHDTLTGGAGDDELHGDEGDDSLDGGAGDDILEGNEGGDTLRGGAGNDTFLFNVGDGQDTIILDGDKDSTDRLQFGDDIGKDDLKTQRSGEDLVIRFGADAFDNDEYYGDEITLKGWYTDADKRIDEFVLQDGTVLVWDDAANGLIDKPATPTPTPGGDDTVPGGNDTVPGGNDTLPGSDIITDPKPWHEGLPGEKTPKKGSVGTKNNDILKGGKGADVLKGKGGHDRLIGGKGADRVLGASGNDWLEGGKGDDLLKGGAGNDWLSGGKGNDTLKGGAGNDTLSGGAGKDTLTGGGGADVFLFYTKAKKNSVDTITDFKSGQGDRIALKQSLFAQLAVGQLGADNFCVVSKKNNNKIQGKDDNDYIIYNTKTGALLYDRDGKGGAAAVQIATLKNKPKNLSAADIFVVQ